MQMTMVEYVLLQAIILFDPECLALTLKGQEAVNEKRAALLSSLRKHLDSSMNKVESAYRFAAILLRVSQCHVRNTLGFKKLWDTVALIYIL
uniref:NR LBD domain-containing protein n=1 Tax=Panagrolaimus superbus TaxID=310955 RepID=A0A914YF09_9BILA